MKTMLLSLASLKSRPLNTALCVVAAAAATTLLSAALLFSQGLSEGLSRNARGIDIVAGAKGSPLQLVLSSVYHVDVPTGNIAGADYERLKNDARVRTAIPLALGDNYRGWRIVGTSADYIALYNGKIAQGRVFAAPFEAVAGAATALSPGQEFAGAHGLSADSDDIHKERTYKVTGTLAPTGTVLDRLILTPVSSVQALHEHHGHEDGHHDEEAHEHEHEDGQEHHGEVTAVLLQMKNRIAALNFPRQFNRDSAIMAAAPAYEITRLARNAGIGRSAVLWGGVFFTGLAALMLLSSLASSLSLRQYDLAVLRVLGAPPRKIAAIVLVEALAVTGAGVVAGLIAGHAAAYLFALQTGGLVSAHGMLAPSALDAFILGGGLLTGVIAAIVPAMLAARKDIAALLARGRG